MLVKSVKLSLSVLMWQMSIIVPSLVTYRLKLMDKKRLFLWKYVVSENCPYSRLMLGTLQLILDETSSTFYVWWIASSDTKAVWAIHHNAGSPILIVQLELNSYMSVLHPRSISSLLASWGSNIMLRHNATQQSFVNEKNNLKKKKKPQWKATHYND